MKYLENLFKLFVLVCISVSSAGADCHPGHVGSAGSTSSTSSPRIVSAAKHKAARQHRSAPRSRVTEAPVEAPEAVMHRFSRTSFHVRDESSAGTAARMIRDWLAGKSSSSPMRAGVTREEYAEALGCSSPEEAAQKVAGMHLYHVDITITQDLFEMAYLAADERVHWASYRSMPEGTWALFDKESSIGIDLGDEHDPKRGGCFNPFRFHPEEVEHQEPPPEHMHVAKGNMPTQCRQRCSEGFMSAPPRRVQIREARPRYASATYRQPPPRFVMRPQFKRRQFRQYRPHQYRGPHFRQAPPQMVRTRRGPPQPGPQWRGVPRSPVYIPPQARGGPMNPYSQPFNPVPRSGGGPTNPYGQPFQGLSRGGGPASPGGGFNPLPRNY